MVTLLDLMFMTRSVSVLKLKGSGKQLNLGGAPEEHIPSEEKRCRPPPPEIYNVTEILPKENCLNSTLGREADWQWL